MSGLQRVQWALRKASLPVPIEGLVLDVGAGSCPYPRSDILLERYVTGQHRCGGGMVADRPLVLGDAAAMPFKDKAFDFVIASHILEHMPRPEIFLEELMRVSHAGYIETPNVMLERLSPYDVHVLEVMLDQGRLVLHKKPAPIHDRVLADLQLPLRDPRWAGVFFGSPEMFHVRLFWRDRIPYVVLNPEQQCDWPTDDAGDDSAAITHTYPGTGWRTWGLKALRAFYRQRRRRYPIQWERIIACPRCHKDLVLGDTEAECHQCGRAYPWRPQPDFLRFRPL